MANSESSTAKSGRLGVADDARSLFKAVDEALRETEGELTRLMRERPMMAVGAAAGIGYLLGGGLTPRVAARLATAGGRMMLAASLERWLVDQLGLAAGAASRLAGGADDSGKEARR